MYGYDPENKSFRHFPYNENPTRELNTTSINRRYWQAGEKFTHAYEGLRSPHASALHCNPQGFAKK